MKKLLTRNLLLSIAFVICGLSFASCQKEAEQEIVYDGAPLKSLTFSASIPQEAVAVTKANSVAESNISNLVVILIPKEDGGTATVLPVSNLGDPTKVTDTNWLYEFTLDLQETGLKTGVYYMYAVANYDKHWIDADVNSLSGKTKAEIDAIVVEKLASNTDLDFAGSILMSGKYCEGTSTDGTVYLQGNENPNRLSGRIHLRRIVSKVTFTFQNDGDMVFEPHAFNIYNYSRSSTLMEREGWDGSDPQSLEYAGSNAFAATQSDQAISGTSFSFYMPENVQVPANEVATYNDRERHTNLTSTQGFANAPANATYVVVKGTFKKGSNLVGDATYTIHLGDFSSAYTGTKSSNKYGNFSVRRNYKYNFTVTVKGVNNIITECTTDDLTAATEPQPGAEGHVIRTGASTTTYRLDAHYEQAMISFTKPSGRISECNISVNTPFTSGTIVDKDGSDTELVNKVKSESSWIKFGRPTSTTAFAAYNASNVVDIYTLLDEIYNGTYSSSSHYLLSGTTVYVAAYVSENYYEDKALEDFVNKDDRIIVVATSQAKISADGKSSYTEDGVLFSVRQKSIKSIIKFTTDNPFGIETVEEDAPNQSIMTAPTAGSSTHYGWQNFVDLLTAQSVTLGTTQWNSVVNVSKNGHFSSTDRGSAVQSTYDYGFYQCITRNRDENGNGVIDQAEIKWYLPSYDQYCELFLGENDLPTTSRLYPQSQALGYSSVGSALYFSSTNDQKRMYFASQGISSNGYKSDAWIKTLITDGHIRCARSLKSYNEESTAVGTKDGNIISVDGLSDNVMRTYLVDEEYSPHVQRGSGDAITYQFEVASANLATGYTISSSSDGLAETVSQGNVCASATIDGKSGWRVPSVKELFEMEKLGYLTSTTNYACRTNYGSTFTTGMDNHYGFTGGVINTFTKTNSTPSGTLYVRCVRDVANAPAVLFRTSTNAVSAAATAGSATFKVLADSDVAWTISYPETTGLTISPTSGTGTADITITDSRSAQSTSMTTAITVTTTNESVATKVLNVTYTRLPIAAESKTYTWTLANGDMNSLTSTSVGSKGSNPSLTWTASFSTTPTTYWNSSDGVNLYSNGYYSYFTTYSLSTSGLNSYYIKSVSVTTSNYSSSSPSTDLTMKVNGATLKTSTITSTSTTYTIDDVNLSGAVEIGWRTSSYSNMDFNIKEIKIEYYEGAAQ